MPEKKDVKEVKSYSLKPVNIAWLRKKAFELSTLENEVSASQLLDELIDDAREREQSPSSKKSRAAADIALVN